MLEGTKRRAEKGSGVMRGFFPIFGDEKTSVSGTGLTIQPVSIFDNPAFDKPMYPAFTYYPAGKLEKVF
jgi:hypothetical protein